MKQAEFKSHEKIIVRTPLYSYTTLFDTINETKNLDETVNVFLNDDIFLEGLYWSSPQLHQSVLDYKKGCYNPAKEPKLLLTLKKYLIRACTRCTPYGIFAGCGIAGVGDVDGNDDKKAVRKVRIDMGLLQQIRSSIESNEEIWQFLYYKINDTLYNLHDQYRFIESIIENGKYSYQVSSIEQTELLQKIIELGEKNVFSFTDIHNLLKNEYSKKEIKAFVKSLIEAQFLISELQLSLTVEDELERFKAILNRIESHKIKSAGKYIHLLSCFEQQLQKLNTAPLGQILFTEIDQLRNMLDECNISNIPEHLFQVDLLKSAPVGFLLSNQNIHEIEDAIKILGKLSSDVSPHESILSQFKKIFLEKYENCEVPLLEALDPESGVGFLPQESIGDIAHNSFISNINIVEKGGTSITLDKAQLWLQDKTEMLDIYQLRNDIQLTEDDLKDLEDKTQKLSSQISVMGTLLPSNKIFLQSIGGANANALLGRFAYLDNEFSAFSKTLSNEEKNNHEDIVFAEIVHIPEGRTGNIARRIRLYDYEIPILTTGDQKERNLYLKDLTVSVIGNEIVLRSKSLNKRVIPRLNNAHNYHKSMIPAYKFLAAIQHQHKLGFNINWGAWASKKRCLPRISYKNIILHRATWHLQSSDLASIKRSKDPLIKLREFLKNWHIPQFVCVAEADNELLIDTHNDSYMDVLWEQARKHSSLKLVEWLHQEEIAKGSAQKPPFVCQFILPLSKKNITPIVSFKQSTVTENKLPRSFAPGSEWLYFKIYCSAFVSDIILASVIKPAIQSLSEAGIIQKAFFIRYKDPHYHLRFRMLLSNAQDKNQFTVAASQVYELLRPFCEEKSAWKIQMDTYEREMERYNEKAIVKSESAFYHDSLLLLHCLEESEFRESDEIRFLAGMKNIDKWLSLFDMDTMAKWQFCDKAAKEFSLEFGKQLKVQLDMKFRTLKNIIPNFMQSDSFNNYFDERDKQLNELCLPIENLASYIHMSQNRWFITQQRLQEYMSYYFCGRYYNRLLNASSKQKVLFAEKNF